VDLKLELFYLQTILSNTSSRPKKMKSKEIESYFKAAVLGLTHLVPIPNEAVKELYRIAEPQIYKKGQTIIQLGEVVTGIHFMVKGLAKSFTYRGQSEITSWIIQEGEPFTNYKSYAYGVPSKESTVALENGFGFFLPKSKLMEVTQKYNEVAILIIKLNERNFVKLDDRVYELLFEDAESRYLNFRKEFPNISNRMILKDIASYLNMTPETLSRIKKKLSNEQV
jgi:CRP-like cAMP-binding protein